MTLDVRKLVTLTIRTTQASGSKQIITADWRVIDCQGETYVTLPMAGKTIKVPCVAIQKMLPDVDVVIGTDVLKHFKFCLDYGKFSIAAVVVSNEMPVDNLTITKNYLKSILMERNGLQGGSG